MDAQKKKKYAMITVIAIFLCIITTVLAVWKINEYFLELSIPDELITLEYGIDKMPEVTALCKGTLLNKKGTPVETIIEGNLNTSKLGTYEVIYKAEYKNISVTESRTVIVQDTFPPEIKLVSDPKHYTSPIGTYEEEGYTAIDSYDGDVTDQVICTEHDGIVTYTVKDSSGNEATVDRTIIYKDVVPPEITLKNDIKIKFTLGKDFIDPGYTATDDVDGNITSKVQVHGNVNLNKVGIYTLTYTVKDNAGNIAKSTRTVYVYQKQTTADITNPGNKVVYLTFDDGPGKYTSKLLDILDTYGVKATFFVTNQYPAYKNMIGEAHRRGHTIALHTYNHDYSDIYNSEEAYYNDLQKIHNIVVNQTGTTPKIVRFPGGTSNGVSKKYCNGIMTSLSQSISYHGYLYCDWNVSSEDAGGASTAEAVAENVINGIQKRNISIVLQHDIKSYSVEAVEEIIIWGLANGYTFLPMSTNTPMVHFSPQN